ncbi:MAG: oxidoreductase [Emergencia sp.]|nr:oxidoreductase [Emergencia sp.]
MRDHVDFDLLAVVNSPGAALIGDDLKRIASEIIQDRPVIALESPGYSRHIWDGYSKACSDLIDRLVPSKCRFASDDDMKCVNLLGLSIFHKYYQGDIIELKRLLALCGIDVNCSLCCDCSVEEIKNLRKASLNVVVDPVYGLETAKILKQRYNMPYLSLPGLPVGFSDTERFIHTVSCALSLQSSKFDVESEKARARAYIYLSRLNSLTGLPKGAKFAVHGTASQCLAYSRFLIHYLGMSADSISVINQDCSSADFNELQKLLHTVYMSDALKKDILKTNAQIVFSDGNIIAKLKALHHSFSGIEISLPSLGYTDVIPKTHLGLSGSLLICEQVINGLMY